MANVATPFALLLSIPFVLSLLGGCGDTEAPLHPIDLNRQASGTLAAEKLPLRVSTPAAPTAPGAGIPFVKEVGYYSDWKLTKPLTGSVPAGETIFIKVVFSEPMRFKPAADNSARPILYYRLNRERTRFRIAEHGAGGKAFVSGDAKPLRGGTDDYISKYTVPAEGRGTFRIEIGKFNADGDGNPLATFYTHPVVLHLGEPIIHTSPEPAATGTGVKPSTEVKSAETADTTAPRVVSFTYYLDQAMHLEVGEGESVAAGTSVYTLVRFSEPVLPKIFYETGTEKKWYSYSTDRGVHWRNLCKPVLGEDAAFLCHATAWEDAFSVTVTDETADLAGNTLIEPVTSHTLAVIPEVPPISDGVPTEPETPLSEPTWPEQIRPLLEQISLPDNLSYVESSSLRDPFGHDLYGQYDPLKETVSINRALIEEDYGGRDAVWFVCVHEIFHAHQDALTDRIGLLTWTHTAEGRAFVTALQKDRGTVGKAPYDSITDSTTIGVFEYAAETFARWWAQRNGWHIPFYGTRSLETEAPHRFKWAEEWFR